VYQGILMPSGSFATAVFNSIYNSFQNRYCFKRALPEENFDKSAALATFGDDL